MGYQKCTPWGTKSDPGGTNFDLTFSWHEYGSGSDLDFAPLDIRAVELCGSSALGIEARPVVEEMKLSLMTFFVCLSGRALHLPRE